MDPVIMALSCHHQKGCCLPKPEYLTPKCKYKMTLYTHRMNVHLGLFSNPGNEAHLWYVIISYRFIV